MLHRLNKYIFLKSLSGMAIAFVGVSASVVMVDLVEQSRAVAGIQGATFLTAIQYTLMRLPGLTSQSIPITALVGTLLAFTSLSRRSEITAMRAAGISAWRFLAPLGWLAIMIGLLITFVIDPMSAKLNQNYEDDKNRLTSVIQLDDDSKNLNSIWVTLPAHDHQVIVNGFSKDPITQSNFSLSNATVFIYDKNGLNLQKTIDTKLAVRHGTDLILNSNYSTTIGDNSNPINRYVIKLSNSTFSEGARDPKMVPLWQLPKEAEMAKINGGSPERYWLRFFRQLLLPITILSMVLFAGIMSIGLDRSGGKIKNVFIALVVGIGIYFANEAAGLMASSGRIPVLVAALCPPLLAISLILAYISYKEDGNAY